MTPDAASVVDGAVVADVAPDESVLLALVKAGAGLAAVVVPDPL